MIPVGFYLALKKAATRFAATTGVRQEARQGMIQIKPKIAFVT